ncbi:MAG: hypothetical protein ACJ74O_17890 [Frankiaceae bacterium]
MTAQDGTDLCGRQSSPVELDRLVDLLGRQGSVGTLDAVALQEAQDGGLRDPGCPGQLAGALAGLVLGQQGSNLLGRQPPLEFVGTVRPAWLRSTP